ncbi:MAG: GNAT family N-acetyltransferase [Flavisolibacter sp.]|nr:GNAT family N-acetyltransferase [Flavisolibacter sp.]MBD0296074.1 GNAT family N-acetyltransferase [Flavisolibacter sp.]MBD0350423.1 GNAT family N-acetyltransferase [Flavisolibacter sp.]
MLKQNHSRSINGYNLNHSFPRIEQEIGNNIDALVPLFEEYRIENGYPSNERCVKSFLSDRIYFHDSIIYTAYIGDKPIGFVQLYPFYTLLDLKKQWVLNDLFVLPGYRRRGIGKALLQEAFELAKKSRSKGIIIQAPVTTSSGKHFCESVGLQKDQDSFYYKYHHADIISA